MRALGPQLAAGRSIQHVNSTAVGGGVAEILTRMVPLKRELGIDVHWDVLEGGESFFALTNGRDPEVAARRLRAHRRRRRSGRGSR
jgi:hypothetical protein